MTHRSTLAAVVTTALAVVAAPLLVPSDGITFKGINLGNSVLTLAPTSQLQVDMQITAVGWEEAETGMTLTIYPQAGVAVRAGDSLGQNSQLLPPEKYSVITITKVSDTELSAKLTIPVGPTEYNLPVTTLGVFDPLGEVLAPTFTDFGHVTGDPTRLRERVWIDYYGLKTAVTLIDG